MDTMQTRAYINAFRLAVIIAIISVFFAPAARAADTTLVPTGATWRYLDNGSDQGTAWRAASFNDSTWGSGPAQLGYGDGDEATTLGFGPDSNNKFITSYFRRSFSVTNAALFNALTLRLMRDDGAVVYLNGVEVWRTNMPTGTVGFLTPASVAIAGADESTFVQTTISPALLVTGTNVLAVELHQSGGTSTDISFDLQLIGSDSSASVTRGPYLQIGTPNSTVVRWRTNIATDSRISYGTTQGSLTTNADNAHKQRSTRWFSRTFLRLPNTFTQLVQQPRRWQVTTRATSSSRRPLPARLVQRASGSSEIPAPQTRTRRQYVMLISTSPAPPTRISG